MAKQGRATGGILVDAIGSRVHISFDESVDAATRDILIDGWRDALLPPLGEGEQADAELTAVLGARGDAGPTTVASSTVEGLASALTVQVTLTALELARGRMLLFHACGVVTDDGDVVVFIGPSGRGKTTAARALGARFGYLSDETIGISDDLSVVPYAKPLSIIEEVGRIKAQRAPSSLGMRALQQGEYRLAALVILDRTTDGPAEPEVSLVPLGDALAELVPHTSYLGELPNPLSRIVIAAERTGGIRRISYSDSSRLADAVAELIATRHDESEPWSQYAVGGSVSAASGALVWADVADAVEIDGSPVVLHNQTVHVLDGLGPVAWDAARTGATEADLLEAALAAYGPPPEGQDASARVAEAVSDLLERGLLVRVGAAPADAVPTLAEPAPTLPEPAPTLPEPVEGPQP